jgi:hypothetical protein
MITLCVVAFSAIRAIAAANRRRDHHAITGRKIANFSPNLLHHAYSLVSEDGAWDHTGKCSPHHVQVGAADGARCYLDDRVSRVFQGGLSDVFEADVAYSMKNNGSHLLLLTMQWKTMRCNQKRRGQVGVRKRSVPAIAGQRKKGTQNRRPWGELQNPF